MSSAGNTRSRFSQVRQLAAMASAERHLLARNQCDRVFAAERAPQFLDAVAVHDHGTMDAHKIVLRQLGGKRAQRLAHAIMAAPRMHLNIVPGGLKEFNFVQRNKDRSAPFLERQSSTRNHDFCCAHSYTWIRRSALLVAPQRG